MQTLRWSRARAAWGLRESRPRRIKRSLDESATRLGCLGTGSSHTTRRLHSSAVRKSYRRHHYRWHRIYSDGIDAAGHEAQAGGWGHLLGDEGSGYDIARRAFQAVVRAADGRGVPTPLSSLMLDALGFSQSRNLIPWIHSVSKDKVAQLAGVVFDAAAANDPVAGQILDEAADELTLAARLVIEKLGFSQPFNLVLSGGIFTHQPTFVASLRNRLQDLAPHARVCLPKREPAYGAVLLAIPQQCRLG